MCLNNKNIKSSVKNQHHSVSDMFSVGDGKVTKDTLNVCVLCCSGVCVCVCVMCRASWGQKEMTHCFLKNTHTHTHSCCYRLKKNE